MIVGYQVGAVQVIDLRTKTNPGKLVFGEKRIWIKENSVWYIKKLTTNLKIETFHQTKKIAKIRITL